jgi:hypothetical protein
MISDTAAYARSVAWTKAECAARGVKGLLLVYSHANDYDSGPLGTFAKRHSVTTQIHRRVGGPPALGVEAARWTVDRWR